MTLLDFCTSMTTGDRAFKIRPVIQALQKIFFRGYRLGAWILFDEGMVPMRHRRNPMRQFMPMKSNKPRIAPGTETNYYGYPLLEMDIQNFANSSNPLYIPNVPLEIYCGKANDNENTVAQRAVVKNLSLVLRGQPARRLVYG
ncbi:Hypothetical protein PHPALM_8909 [Phytophthora palmivora]|uniref:PiggyBac transposable element-derived protein domain-containing protein n=1 Tax=Phytophthora palmivora TaxID=4796 RepID=A0A2P4Y8M6_9STRA|nr:Hypothetical protein PHPALM_8909 [Phytophthora palmivora]